MAMLFTSLSGASIESARLRPALMLPLHDQPTSTHRGAGHDRDTKICEWKWALPQAKRGFSSVQAATLLPT
jgi:hypothetical protein